MKFKAGQVWETYLDHVAYEKIELLERLQIEHTFVNRPEWKIKILKLQAGIRGSSSVGEEILKKYYKLNVKETFANMSKKK